MASNRPRRNVTAPKKFGEEEGYLLPVREPIKSRRVYRVLGEQDLNPDINLQTVFVLWPDDNEWYQARLIQVNQQTWDAKLVYKETREEEDVNISLLVKDQHIACLEHRGPDEMLQEGDILIDERTGTSVMPQGKRKRRRSLLQPVLNDTMEVDSPDPRPMVRVEIVPDVQGDTTKILLQLTPSLSDQKTIEFDRDEGLLLAQSTMDGMLPCYDESVEDIVGVPGGVDPNTFGPMGLAHEEGISEPDDCNYNMMAGQGLHTLEHAGSTGSQMGTTNIRERIFNQLVADLEIAVQELKEKKANEEPGSTAEHLSANEMGRAVEMELFLLCGWEVKDYKAKARSLHFNLKDPKNPDLRAQVLQGKIAAHALVRMSAQELASSEEKKWREQKTEEFLKQSVLDTDTAASFSTAAAVRISQDLKKEREDFAAADAVLLAAGSTGDLQTLSRRASGAAELAFESSRGEETQEKLKSGGATELSAPEFDIAEAVRKAQEVAKVVPDEDLVHIEVPPSPPLSPLRSTSEDEENAPKKHSEELGDPMELEGDLYDPLSPAVGDDGGEAGAIQDAELIEALPDWAMEVDDKDQDAAAGVESKDNKDPENVGSYSPTSGPNSTYSPTSGWNNDIQDMSPLVMMPKSSSAQVGTKAWEGSVIGDSGDYFRVVCESMAGVGDLSLMITGTEVSIKGRVGSERVEQFLDDLRTSKNRTVTLGVMKLCPEATAVEQTFLNELIMQHTTKGRTAVIGPSPNMEGYLVPRCKLTARLCVTARNAVPLEQKAFIKDNIRTNGELLLVLIHRKNWKPPGAPVSIPSVDATIEGGSQAWTGPNVLKWGVSKEVAVEAGVHLETGIAPVQAQGTHARAVDPRLKDPRLRAGIRDPEPEEKLISRGDAKKPALPPGVTPKAINDLAALFGIGGTTAASGGGISNLAASAPMQLNVTRSHNIPVQPQPAARDLRQSSHNNASSSGAPNAGQISMQGVWNHQQQVPAMQPQIAYTSSHQQGHPIMQHHKMDGVLGQVPQMIQVPGGQPQSFVFLQGRPQFLSYDPATRKAIPLDPSTVQYDPSTNQVMLVGAMPPGVPNFPTQMVQQFCGQQGREQGRVLVNSQGIPIFVKKAKKDHMGDTDMEDEEEEAQRALIGGHALMGTMQRSHQANVAASSTSCPEQGWRNYISFKRI